MFQVFCNNKPADTKGFPNLTKECWANSTFSTFEEAHDYAVSWLGHFEVGDMELGKVYDYSGYGDTIEIREV